MERDIFTAKRSFVTMHRGLRVHVHAGDTTVRGHWLLKDNAEYFKPFEITHDVGASKGASS